MGNERMTVEQLRKRLTHYLLHGVGDVSEEAVEGSNLAEESRAAIESLIAEVSSLRRSLAVTRAALAQCATALESARAWVCGNDERSQEMALEENRRISAALSNPDVEHAVRVEAARDAVIQAARKRLAMWTRETYGDLVDAFAALDTLTSERKP